MSDEADYISPEEHRRTDSSVAVPLIPKPQHGDQTTDRVSDEALACAAKYKAATSTAFIERVSNELLAARSELKKLQAAVSHLNEMLRQTGYGQGQIDAYAAQCEVLEQVTRERDAALSLLSQYNSNPGGLTLCNGVSIGWRRDPVVGFCAGIGGSTVIYPTVLDAIRAALAEKGTSES